MNEKALEGQFDYNLFQNNLAAKTEEFAENNYPISRPNEKQEKKQRAAELRVELLNDCATAMIESGDAKEVMEIIRQTLIEYQYGAGSFLFPGTSRETFYHDLAIAIADKALKAE